MSLESDLFEHIDNRNFSKANTFLSNNLAINVNGIDDEGRSFLMAAVLRGKRLVKETERKACHAFIEQLLSRRDFQCANTPVDESEVTSFHMAIGEDPRLIQLFIKYKASKHIEVVFNYRRELFCEKQQEEINRLLAENNSPVALENAQKVQEVLIPEAVDYALRTDDPEILIRLLHAGVGVMEEDLRKAKKGKNVQDWLSKMGFSCAFREHYRSVLRTYYANRAEVEKAHVQSVFSIFSDTTSSTSAGHSRTSTTSAPK